MWTSTIHCCHTRTPPSTYSTAAAPHASLHATHSGHTLRPNTHIQCGASVSSVEARERKVEEDECTEEITFKHVCKGCDHVICEHYHSFSFDDKHQDYMMECVLCGKGVDQILIDPTNGGDDGGAGVLSAAAGGAGGGGAGGGGGETKGADRDIGVEEDIEEIRRAVQEVVTGANVPEDVVGGAVVEKGGGPVAAAAALNLIDSSPLMQQEQQAAAAAADAAAAKAAQGGGAGEGDDSDDGGWDD